MLGTSGGVATRESAQVTEQDYRPLQLARDFLEEARVEIAGFDLRHDDERLQQLAVALDLLVGVVDDIERLAITPPELRVLRPRE